MQYYTQQTQSLVESTYNLYVNAQGKRRLTDDFVPGPYDVVCARGKAAHNSEGNRRFRALVEEHAPQYGSCTCKYEKSKIVSHIVSTVRTAAAYHQGGFVKQSGPGWFEVGDRAAKEKIGQTFRDLLHTKYSSSTKAKARVRIQRRMGEDHDDDDHDDHSEERSVEHNKVAVQKTKPLPFPSLKDITFNLRNSLTKNSNRTNSTGETNSSGGGSSSSFMTGMNNMMAPFTGRSSRTNSGSNNRRSSVRLTPMAVTPDHNDSMNTANAVVGTPSNNIAPPQALTDSAVLDTLRSSVATVELPPDCYPPNTRNASANWKTDSVLSNMSMVNMSLTSTSGGCQPPLEIDLPLGGDGGPSPTHNRLGGDPLHPYGIFSSSTRNNPFGNAAVLDSTTSSSGGRMASSTNSRGSLSMSMMGSLPLDMKDLDMDGLLDSMDSMGFQGMMIDPMMIDQ